MTAFQERMAELRRRFIDRACGDRYRLHHALAAGDVAQVQHISHGLAGIAGTFGFHDLGEAAAALDAALDEGGDASDMLVAPLLDCLAAIDAA